MATIQLYIDPKSIFVTLHLSKLGIKSIPLDLLFRNRNSKLYVEKLIIMVDLPYHF